ncbi:hypothetical protein CR513_24737, partial [Mucuna pruriens]
MVGLKDSSSNPKGGGVKIILEGPEGVTLEHSLRFNFKASNNQAKYARLDLEREVGALQIRCHTDSQLVAEHIKGTYQVKDPLLLKYNHQAQTTLQRFDKRKGPIIANDGQAKSTARRGRGKEWISPIWNYLKHETSLEDKADVAKIPLKWKDHGGTHTKGRLLLANDDR